MGICYGSLIELQEAVEAIRVARGARCDDCSFAMVKETSISQRHLKRPAGSGERRSFHPCFDQTLVKGQKIKPFPARFSAHPPNKLISSEPSIFHTLQSSLKRAIRDIACDSGAASALGGSHIDSWLVTNQWHRELERIGARKRRLSQAALPSDNVNEEEARALCGATHQAWCLAQAMAI